MGKAIIIKDADFSQVAVSSNAIPLTSLAISGGTGSQTQRQVQLSVEYAPANTTQKGVQWAVVSGNATINSSGLLSYNGTAANANVTVRATSTRNNSIYAQKTISFAMPTVEAPTFSPAQGTYNAVQQVALACATDGATIHYTTNGDTPTSSSPTYSQPISVSENMTIKAIAVKNGDTSPVASASYVIEIPHTVTVNVSDGTDVITDATVAMNNGGVDIQPSSSSGGVYVFSVVDGNYTLSVSKSGYDTHTETVVVNGSDVTKSVTLNVTTQVNLLAHAEFFNNLNSYISDSEYYCFSVNGRGTILVPNSYVETPISWYYKYTKEGYSPVEIPSGAHSVDIMFTNTAYKLYLYVGKQSGNTGNGLISYTLKAGEPFRLKMTNYSTAAHIIIAVRRVGNDDTNYTGTSIADLGLTCVANLAAPSDITYDMTPNLTLLNGIVTSNNEISTNTQRASLVAAKAINYKFQEYTSGNRLSEEGATYAKPTIPIGAKQVKITITNTDYKVAWFRLLQETSSTTTTTVDTNAQLGWSAGQASPYVVSLPFTDKAGFYFQCNISKSGADVNTSIEELGLKVEYIL